MKPFARPGRDRIDGISVHLWRLARLTLAAIAVTLLVAPSPRNAAFGQSPDAVADPVGESTSGQPQAVTLTVFLVYCGEDAAQPSDECELLPGDATTKPMAVVLPSPGGSFSKNGFELDPVNSTVQMAGADAGSEVYVFQRMSGTIAPNGAGTLNVGLSSIETNNKDRNVFMRVLLFEANLFPDAVAKAQFDVSEMEQMEVGNSISVTRNVELSLHGMNKTFNDVPFNITRTSDTMVTVASANPMLVSAADFGLSNGVEKLSQALGGASIAPAARISFTLIYNMLKKPPDTSTSDTGGEGIKDGYELDPDRSVVSMKTVDGETYFETYLFKKINGTVAADGGVDLKVDLGSLKTNDAQTDAFYSLLLFETFSFPNAIVTAQLDKAELDNLAIGQIVFRTQFFKLSLHGVEKEIQTEISLSRLDEETVKVTSARGVLIEAKDFGLLDGANKLATALGVTKIVPSAEIEFELVYRRPMDEIDPPTGNTDVAQNGGVPGEPEGDPDPEEEFGTTGEIIDGDSTPVTTADLYLPYCGDDAIIRDPSCPQDLVLFPESLPDGSVYSPYSTVFLRAEGGEPPLLGFAYIGWGEPLDLERFVPGLKLTRLDGSDGNLFRIDGVPTIAGDYQITFGVGEDTGTGDKKEYTLRIRPPGLSLSPASLPDGAVNVAYGPVTFDVKGGIPPYVSFLAGKSAKSPDNDYEAIETLIPGLTVTRTGASNTHQFTLAGSPTVAGEFELVFGTEDEAQNNTKKIYTLRIDPPPFGLTPSELPDAIAGQDYGPITIMGYNGTEPINYRTLSPRSGATLEELFPWLTITNDPSGITLGGRPPKPGYAQLTALALDAYGRTASGDYQIMISCPDDEFSLLGECICRDGKVKDEEKKICVEAVDIALAPETLDPGYACSPYSVQFGASGGTEPYSYRLVDDPMPAGLGVTINEDGLLSGTPTSPATLSFHLTVMDDKGNYGAKLYELRIDPPSIVVNASDLPGGTDGEIYSASLTASPDAATLEMVKDQEFPDWLTLSSDGKLEGRPPGPGTYTFVAAARSGDQISCPQEFSLDVSCASGMLPGDGGQCVCKPSLVPNPEGSPGCGPCGADEINFGGTCQKKVKPKDKVVTTTSSCVAPFVPLKPSGCGCPVGKQQEGNDCVDKTQTPTTSKTNTTPTKPSKFSCPTSSQLFKKGTGGENLRTVATDPAGQNECKTCGDGWELFNSEPPASMRRFPVQNAKGANVFWCGQGPATPTPTPTPLPKQNTFTPECPGVSTWNGQSCICNPTVAQIVVCAASNGAYEQFNCTCQPVQQPQFFPTNPPPNPPTEFFDPNFGGDGQDDTYDNNNYDNNEACMSACYQNSEGIGSTEYQTCIQGC